jgi:hypothetical protein
MILHRSRAAWLPLAALAVSSCKASSDLAPVAGPPGEFAYAYASPDCAPWDGRAVSIVLTTTPATAPDTTSPYLQLAIYPRQPEVAARTYRWPADPEVATGSRCTAEGCTPAAAGEIRLGPPRADSALAGTVTLRFGPGDSVAGGFQAVWRDRRMLCG